MNHPIVNRTFSLNVRSGFALAFLCSLALTACSAESPETPDSYGDFVADSSSVTDGAVWKLNRSIQIDFSDDVDFRTVSSSTVRITDEQGFPAVGSFLRAGPRSIRFVPSCQGAPGAPTGGLLPGKTYRLSVSGGDPGSPAPALLSTAGERLGSSLDVQFRTPSSPDESELFHDPVDGPPSVRILGADQAAPDAETSAAHTYVELGLDPLDVEYFRFDGSDEQGEIASVLPLNLYSDPSQRFSIVIAFDQPIDASPENISSDFIGLEYFRQGAGDWRAIPATVELESACDESGGTVRVTPIGVLPQGSSMRAVVRPGFRDIAGQRTSSAQTSFAVFQTATAQPNGLPGQRTTGSDEVLERFTVGGQGPDSKEDTTVPSGLPSGDWGGGTLTAGFGFSGTGGPGGDFDLLVPTGQTLFIDTQFSQIAGGPGGAPTTQQQVVGGVVDLRNLTVEPGGRLIFVGPNIATILATGSVDVRGLISLDGGDNFGVGTLNTTNQPEPGASGQAGGGRGGTGSYLTSASTPRGGAGFGAFDIPGMGGEGGESSYAPLSNCAADNRRAAGGGGGSFGRSVRYYVDTDVTQALAICQMIVGLDGEPGFTGSPDGTGAVSQSEPARGGARGPSPFLDASPNNDFYGTMLRADGTQVVGELPSVWAGSGGGAGGDAVRSATFPLTPFSATGDEKGSGGGGGGGGLLILAVGDIVLGDGGEITADGGTGGGGENTVFFDRIGGGSGGGSGGHIVLSSAGSIVVESEATVAATGSFYRDDPQTVIHQKRPLRALGGQGGAGRRDRCGAGANGESAWRSDGIPFQAFEGREDIPPYTPPALPNSFAWCNEISSCAVGTVPVGTVIGGGGDGAPGLIQLHVADPDTQLVFGSTGTAGYVSQGVDVTRSMSPPPVGWRTPTERPDTLVPFFATRSESFSRWIPLGLARLNPDGSSNPVEFFFEGTDFDGSVLRDGAQADELPAIVPYMSVATSGPAPSIQAATGILRIQGASLADPNSLYRRNPALLREFAVRFHDTSTAAEEFEYPIVAARYDRVADEYTIALDSMGTRLARELADLDARPGMLEVEIVPFFFRMLTGGVPDSLPLGTDVRIKFDATLANPQSGAPSPDVELSYSGRVDAAGMNLDLKNGFAEQIAELNGPVVAPGQTDPTQLTLEEVNWDFVRFKVEFDLGAPSAAAPELPGLDFLRVPFRF